LIYKCKNNANGFLMEKKLKAFKRLLKIMKTLREECPWDQSQTFESLRTLTIEETYELGEAILNQNHREIKEELGDLFMHLVFYSIIAEENGDFDVSEILNDVCEKLIRRHPHIYGERFYDSAQEVSSNWEKIKLQSGKKSVLEGVPMGLPALVKAFRLQDKTAQVGFEWKTPEDVWKKVEEEIAELKEAILQGNPKKIEEEYGDVLFSLVNYGRFLKIDPENALERINKKFKKRFEFIETQSDKPIFEMTLEEMDALWQMAKKQL
jgi:XTP/dITP diphosphohydrolase